MEYSNPITAIKFILPASNLSGTDLGISVFAESMPVPPKNNGCNAQLRLHTKPPMPYGPKSVLCPAKT